VSRIYNPGAYFAKVNAAAAPITITTEAIAYAEQTRRIAEIRKALVADGMDWAEANDKAVERVLIAADHQSADEAADAIQQETR
jgi:hypothetical protein